PTTTSTTSTTEATTTEPTTTSTTSLLTTTSTTTSELTTTTTTTESTTTKPTTTTTEPTITSTAESTTTTTTTTTTTMPSERSAVQHIASDEELSNWSVNDYNSKHDTPVDSAEITETPDGQYQITLTDDSENVLDVYEINPENGIGTDLENNEVNLPQTGNNSLTNIMTALGALIMTGFGFASVKSSGIIRRKKNK
ncbi:MAG: LPXTG cell wall anchor domain-containing protein, partial [Ruminococcus sp.]|nr:LPXTG cell wall anchor domain-containing protein [Ruminococcus sp.]